MGRLDKWSMVLFALCLTFPLTSQGWVNRYDERFDFACPKGQFLRHIASQHRDDKEDRIFALSCTKIPNGMHSARGCKCSWTDYVNTFDEAQAYQCPGEGYLAGMGSYHHNSYEDRRFRFYCCTEPNTIVHNCTYSGWTNSFDAAVYYLVPDGKILRGMVSYHDNSKEDRRFQFEVCDMSRRRAVVG
ncbi:hemagglutinin/amebocyte aggregation factor-like [Babylonia areolata]|uniref:hemagglutinin/amebocyte aggregation factor-like n=1 Tax=Babylonia areolata TaxID=304850 RepID=UPI003FD03F0C